MMKAALSQASAALLCLSMAVVGGQTSSATAGTQQPDPTAAQAAKKEQIVTIVGCLVQGNPSGVASERRSEPGAANANDYFVRTPAVKVPVGTTVTVGGTEPPTKGTTTSAGKPTDTAVYRITGLDAEQLRPHIGHRVELQGHLSGNTDGSGTGTTAKTTVDATGKATTRVETKMGVAGVLHATAIKMVSESCP